MSVSELKVGVPVSINGEAEVEGKKLWCIEVHGVVENVQGAVLRVKLEGSIDPEEQYVKVAREFCTLR